jgi:hypothetical protein
VSIVKSNYEFKDLSLFKNWQEENANQTKAFILTLLYQQFETLLTFPEIKTIKINTNIHGDNQLINNIFIEYDNEIKNKVLVELKNKKEKEKLKHNKNKQNKFYKIKNYLEENSFDMDSYNKSLKDLVSFLEIDENSSYKECKPHKDEEITLKKYTTLDDKIYHKLINTNTLSIIHESIEVIKTVQSEYYRLLNEVKKSIEFTLNNKEDKKLELYGNMNIYIEKYLLEKTIKTNNHSINKIKI